MSDRFDHTLERKLDTKPDGSDEEPRGVRRIELITGVMPKACDARGRRRQWSTAERSRILLESLEPGANVSEVARRDLSGVCEPGRSQSPHSTDAIRSKRIVKRPASKTGPREGG